MQYGANNKRIQDAYGGSQHPMHGSAGFVPNK